MYTILVVILVLISIALIALILLQHGKGADAGAAFGSGASGTVFGAHGSSTFLSHVTSGLATAFFAVTLALAYMAQHHSGVSNSVVDRVHAQSQTAPASKHPAALKLPPAAPASAAAATGAPNPGATSAATAPKAASPAAPARGTQPGPSTKGEGTAHPSSAASSASAATTKTGH